MKYKMIYGANEADPTNPTMHIAAHERSKVAHIAALDPSVAPEVQALLTLKPRHGRAAERPLTLTGKDAAHMFTVLSEAALGKVFTYTDAGVVDVDEKTQREAQKLLGSSLVEHSRFDNFIVQGIQRARDASTGRVMSAAKKLRDFHSGYVPKQGTPTPAVQAQESEVFAMPSPADVLAAQSASELSARFPRVDAEPLAALDPKVTSGQIRELYDQEAQRESAER